MTSFINKPCAAEGYKSYRYLGRYGYIMIGAKDTQDALKEAARSVTGTVRIDKLESWNGQAYEQAKY